MQVKLGTYYVPALYSIFCIFMAINVLSLVSGSWIALLPIALQTLIIVAVYTRRSCAYLVVRAWAAVLIFSGVGLWLAVLLRGGGEIVQPARNVVWQTLLLFIGVPTFRYAKAFLSQRVRSDVQAQQVHHLDA